MKPFEREIAASTANALYLNRALDRLFARTDPGMAVDPRPSLQRAGLIDAEGKPVVEIEQ